MTIGRRPGVAQMTFAVDDEATARSVIGLGEADLVTGRS
jgi:hypothetical protein